MSNPDLSRSKREIYKHTRRKQGQKLATDNFRLKKKSMLTYGTEFINKSYGIMGENITTWMHENAPFQRENPKKFPMLERVAPPDLAHIGLRDSQNFDVRNLRIEVGTGGTISQVLQAIKR